MRTDTNLEATACSQHEQRLAEYLAGELDPVYTRRVEQHMAECANCRSAFESARDAARLFSIAEPYFERAPEPRPEFARLTMARIRVENDRRAAEGASLWQPFVSFAWRFAATAMLALMILLTYAVRGHGRSQKVVGVIGQQQQLPDVFAPDPTRTPANQEEVLLMLAEGNHAESNNAKQ
jgi:predicted anti-sigma-YlaC factor YlaD